VSPQAFSISSAFPNKQLPLKFAVKQIWNSQLEPCPEQRVASRGLDKLQDTQSNCWSHDCSEAPALSPSLTSKAISRIKKFLNFPMV
jgi:hypothetical protein